MRRALYLLAVLVCGLAGAAIYLWRELGQERALNAELRARLDAPAPSATTAVDSGAPSLAAAATTMPPDPAAPSVAAGPSSPPPLSKRADRKDDWQQDQRRALQDPRYRQAWREQSRLTYALRRDNIMRLVGLTQREADAVIDLQIDRELALIEEPNSLDPKRYEVTEKRAPGEAA
jgi:hypothetical protein